MGQAYLCRKSGEAREEKSWFCFCPYICPCPSLHPSVLGILFVYISQGICKELIRMIISPQKTMTKVSVWKISRKINSSSSSSSSSFSSLCSCSLTLSPPSHQLDSWLFAHFPVEAEPAHAGVWEGEEEARLHRGLSCFSTVLHVRFEWFISDAQITHASWMPPALWMSPPALYPWIICTR